MAQMKLGILAQFHDRATKGLNKLVGAAQKLKKIGSVTGQVALNSSKTVGRGIGLAAVGMTGLLAASTQGAIAFESAMADVNKVVEFETPAQFDQFSNDILNLSTRIPMAASALALISAEAGAAGIALEDNLRFTEFTAKSAVAFDMTAAAAGESFADLRNVYSLTQTGLEGMADAVNHLSNNMASKAPELINFINRAGGAAPMLGATATQMAAIGSAMIATGTAPEVAARGITTLATKLKVGGSDIDAALKLVGVSHDTLMTQIDANPGQALIGLFEAIKNSSKGTEALKGLVGQDFVDDLSKVVARTDLLAQSLKLVGDASSFAGSVQEEFDTRAATTANSLELMKNNINVLGVDIGAQILPALNIGLEKVIGFLKLARDETSGVAQTFQSLSTFMTDFFSTIGGWKDTIGASLSALGESFSAVGETIGRIFAMFSDDGEAVSFGHVIGTVVAGGFNLLVKAVDIAAKSIDFVLKGVEGIIGWFKGDSVDWSGFLGEGDLGVVWDTIKLLFKWSPLGLIVENFGAIGETIGGLISGAANTAGAAWSKVKGIFGKDSDPVKIAVQDPASIERALASVNRLKSALVETNGTSMDAISSTITALISQSKGIDMAVQSSVNSALSFLASVSFHYQGTRMMDTLAAGIKARAKVVVAEVAAMTQAMRDHLPSSPAKVGPLSDIHRLKFSETIAGSISPGPMVKAMRAAAMATMAAAAPMAMASPALAVPTAVKPPQVALLAHVNGARPAQAQPSVHIEFRPQISIGAGASVDEAQIRQILLDHADELVALIERKQQEQGRLDF